MESLLTSMANDLARQSWQVAVVFLLVAAACYALRRASAHWRYLLWLVVLAKCLTPPLVKMPLAVLPRPAEVQAKPETFSAAERPSAPVTMAGPEKTRVRIAAAAEEPETATAAAPPVGAVTEAVPHEIAEIPAPAAAKAPTIRSTDPRAWWAAAWCFGAAIFIAYALMKAWAANRRLRLARLAADPQLAAMIAVVARRLGMKTVPAVYLVDGLAQPFVWGWLRGSIYVPRHFLKTGTGEQQEAIFAHELAHVARWDAAVNLVQIVVQASFFFHPLVWWTNRQIRRERENCCDETVIAGLGADPKLYGQAIVDTLVAEYEARQPVPSLAVTGGLKSVEERIETILSPNRKFFRRPSRLAVMTVALLAVCAVPTALELTVRGQPPVSPKVNSANQAVEAPAKTATGKSQAPTALKIAVQAIDANTDMPLAGVPIDVRTFQNKTRKRDNTLKKTDSEGRATLEIRQDPAELGFLSLEARPAGYVPQFYDWTDWTSATEMAGIPGELTMRFQKGITIGGQIQDPSGKPIAGAKVEIMMPATSSHSGGVAFYLGTLKSDKDGRWRCRVAPEDISSVSLTVEHPDFIPGRAASSPAMKEQKHILRLQRGILVRGQVLDTKDQPVKGINVSLGWTWAQSTDPQAKTDALGQFDLKNCPLGPSVVTVQGDGFAPDCRRITVEKENAPLAFRLNPGATLRGRVVDHQGKPLQGVSVASDTWREARTLTFRTETDAEGRFAWNNAPRDAVLFALSAKGFRSNRTTSLTASNDEHTITLNPELVIRGTVVDVQTGKPIDRFQFCSGFRRDTENQTFFSNRFTAGTNGRFEYHMAEEIMPNNYVKVVADGYLPAVSRAFKPTEGEQPFAFKLKKGKGLGGVVLLPDGKPAANTTVALVSKSSHPFIENGSLSPNSSGIRAQTDAAGRFSFVPQDESCSFFALHAEGHAEFNQHDLEKSGSVTLQPWGRLEGVVKIGKQTAKNVGVTFALDSSRQQRGWSQDYETVTDDQGHFAFDRVYPGKGSAARVIVVENGMTQSHAPTNPVQVEVSGKTTRVQIGGKGRAVAGRIETGGRITKWTDAGDVRSKYGVPGEFSDYYSFKVAPDGSFRIDDMAPGKYTIDLRITKPMPETYLPGSTEALRPSTPVGNVEFGFSVPQESQGPDDKPLDLGVIKATFRDQGAVAPPNPRSDTRDVAAAGVAGLSIHFDPGDVAKLPFQSASCQVMWKIPGHGESMMPIEEHKSQTVKLDWRATDLKPGDYVVDIRTVPKPVGIVPHTVVENDPHSGINPGAYYDQRIVSLKPGQIARVDFPFTPFDPDACRGTRTAVVRVEKLDGTPAAGSKINVGYFDGHYGALPVFSGEVPASGEIRLDHVTDRKSLLPGWNRGEYSVRTEDRLIGFFGFAGRDPVERFVFHLPLKAGDAAPDVELFDIAAGKKVRLDDLRGKVVCLEFWATWCGPCQEAMEKLNTLAEEHADDWKDRALIVPVSIDENQEIAKKHVTDRGWNRLTHYWTGDKSHTGTESAAMRAFVGDRVPESILIGPDGRILWRGHPLDNRGGQDLKTRIEAAMKK